MNKEIKTISGNHYNEFCYIANTAFEGLNTDKWLQNHIEETPNENLFGVFKNDKVVAGMRTFNFEMNFCSTPIIIGGVGMIAVDLLHKKERNAYQLMQHFIQVNQAKDINIVMLHPFDVNFYKKMGFGLGTKTHQFYLQPEAFYNFAIKDHLVGLTNDDRVHVLECYNRVYEKTHGMTKRCLNEKELDRPFNYGRVIGYKQDNEIRGYMVGELTGKDLYIHELFFESPEVIKEFSTFLYQQSDQVDKIIINANQDDLLHFVRSPESGMDTMVDKPSSVDNNHLLNTGVGVMYRIINTKGFFDELKNKNHQFAKVSLSIKLTITDQFYPSNIEPLVVEFNDGKIQEINGAEFDTEIEMNISEFSAMVMGAVNFKTLHKWGSAKISTSEYIDDVNQLFLTEDKPVCTKAF